MCFVLEVRAAKEFVVIFNNGKEDLFADGFDGFARLDFVEGFGDEEEAIDDAEDVVLKDLIMVFVDDKVRGFCTGQSVFNDGGDCLFDQVHELFARVGIHEIVINETAPLSTQRNIFVGEVDDVIREIIHRADEGQIGDRILAAGEGDFQKRIFEREVKTDNPAAAVIVEKLVTARGVDFGKAFPESGDKGIVARFGVF